MTIPALILLMSVAAGATALDELVGTDPRITEAHSHHTRGRAAFQREDFLAAAVEFSQAHDAFVAAAAAWPGDGPRLLASARHAKSNEATSWSRAGAPVEARRAFVEFRGAYLDAATPKERQEIDLAIARLEDRIGELVVSGLPPGAEARVDGRPVALEEGVPLPLAAGAHGLEVVASGFDPIARELLVPPRAATRIALAPVPSQRPAWLVVEATVEPARVHVGGEDRGNAPVHLALPPGQHRYRVQSYNHRAEEGTVTLAPGERTRLRVALLPSHAPLGIRIEPSFLLVAALRNDTPFNVDVPAGAPFTSGSPLATGLQLRISTSFDRRNSYWYGAEARLVQRPLNALAIGGFAEWWPTGLRWFDGGLAVCPVAARVAVVADGGRVASFEGGGMSGGVGARIQATSGPISVGLGASVDYEPYERNGFTSLSLLVAGFSFSIGYAL